MADKVEDSEYLEKYKLLLSTQQHSFGLAGEAGSVVIRSLILINGAAAIAILALFDNIGPSAADTLVQSPLGLGTAAAVFALGAASGMWAGIYTQRTLLEYAQIIGDQMKQLISRKTGEADFQPRSLDKLEKLRKKAWFLINLGLILFLVGVLIGAKGLGLA